MKNPLTLFCFIYVNLSTSAWVCGLENQVFHELGWTHTYKIQTIKFSFWVVLPKHCTHCSSVLFQDISTKAQLLVGSKCMQIERVVWARVHWGRRKTIFEQTHKHTCIKIHLHPHSTRKAYRGEENSNEVQVCNILNLAVGLPMQESMHITPSFPRVPCCA